MTGPSGEAAPAGAGANALRFRPRVPVYDANVCVGHPRTGLSPAPDAGALLRALDRLGVDRAVVSHAHAEDASPRVGNDLLAAALAGHEARLTPQWTVSPTDDSLPQVQALHAAGRVSSVRLYRPPGCEVPFARWAYAPLLDWLLESGVPLWLPLPEVDPAALVATLDAYPGVEVVLVGAHYTHAALLRPLLRALPGARLELSRHETLGDVEALCAEFGAGRFLYGSWFPRYSMGPMLYYLHHTALSDPDLALLCAGNLERLLRTAGATPAAGADAQAPQVATA